MPTTTSSALSHDERLQATNGILAIVKTAAPTSMVVMFSAKEKLAAYSDSTITLIANATRNYSHRNVLIEAVINETNENTVREVLSLHVHCPSTVEPPAHRSHELIGIIRGLYQLERFKDRKLEDLTGEDLRVAVTLMNFTSALSRIKYSGLYVKDPDYVDSSIICISDPKLTQLITEAHPDNHEAIFEIIKERGINGTLNIDALIRDMEETTAPLRNGIL